MLRSGAEGPAEVQLAADHGMSGPLASGAPKKATVASRGARTVCGAAPWQTAPRPREARVAPRFTRRLSLFSGTPSVLTDPISKRYHVGDTPMDLQAAEGGGAQGVGVTTGIFSRAQLVAAGPGAAACPKPSNFFSGTHTACHNLRHEPFLHWRTALQRAVADGA